MDKYSTYLTSVLLAPTGTSGDSFAVLHRRVSRCSLDSQNLLLGNRMRRIPSVMAPESQPDFFNVELEGRPTRAYNQAAFRYFLSIEQRRTERTGRPFALLLVERKGQADGRIDTETATTLFAGLSLCLRETDFIGWYDQGAVAGAVLTHLGDTRTSDATHRVRQRVVTRCSCGPPA